MTVDSSPCHPCILCGHSETAHFHTDKKRDYYRCVECQLVFVPPAQHLTTEQEKAEYDKHENNLLDQGYLTFLSRVAIPLLSTLKLEQLIPDFGHPLSPSRPLIDTLKGMEFGCGPGPALGTELRRLGLNVAFYDLYYFNEPALLNQQYDFVTCTEVVEHFNSPNKDLPELLHLAKPGGIIALMTKLVIDQARFSNWHYKNDPTHVAFFSEETFNWVGHHYGFDVDILRADVILLTKH